MAWGQTPAVPHVGASGVRPSSAGRAAWPGSDPIKARDRIVRGQIPSSAVCETTKAYYQERGKGGIAGAPRRGSGAGSGRDRPSSPARGAGSPPEGEPRASMPLQNSKLSCAAPVLAVLGSRRQGDPSPRDGARRGGSRPGWFSRDEPGPQLPHDYAGRRVEKKMAMPRSGHRHFSLPGPARRGYGKVPEGSPRGDDPARCSPLRFTWPAPRRSRRGCRG